MRSALREAVLNAMKLAQQVVAAGSLGLILPGLFLGPGGAAVAAAAAPAGPCRSADALLQAGDYAAARAAYSALPPTYGCAQSGMTASSALLAASDLITVGQAGAAVDDLARAANADPALIPFHVLSLMVEQRALALAKLLQADGLHQQASQILQFVQETHPVKPLDPAALTILAPPAESPWTWIRPLLLSWPGFTSLVAFALLGLLVLQRTRRRLHLQLFALDDSLTGVDPEAFRSRVRDELQRLVARDDEIAGERRPRIDIAGPYDDRVPIAALIDQGGPQAQFVKALLDVVYDLFPNLSVPRLVTGTLMPDVTIRMGMQTLDMVERDAATIEYKKLDVKQLGIPRNNAPAAASSAAADYACLALPAAAWVILSWYKRRTLCGTRDFESFSLFAIGRAWEDLNRLTEAEQCYAAAYEKDRKNLGAAVNLGRLRQGSGRPPGSHLGKDGNPWSAPLEEVAKATRWRRHRLQWHQSRYLLSLGLSDAAEKQSATGLAAETRERAHEERDRARRLAVDLALMIEKQLRRPRWISWFSWFRRTDRLREFLDNSRGPALALAASQLIPDAATLTAEAVAATGANPAKVDDRSVIRTLRDARKGLDIQPQILASVAAAQSPENDEVAYSLYQYQRRRAQVCEDAIAEIKRQPRLPSLANKEDREQAEGEKEEKLRALVAVRDDASSAENRYREQLANADDVVVQRRLVTFDQPNWMPASARFVDGDHSGGSARWAPEAQ
jgi:hypothetical protein